VVSGTKSSTPDDILGVAFQGSGRLKAAVPLAAFTSNFSSMPLMAPPPLGREIYGMSMAIDLDPCSCERAAAEPEGFDFPDEGLSSLFRCIFLN